MLKTCLNCGLQFDGAPQAKFHSNACRVAYSRKLAQADGEPEQAEPAQPEPAQSELGQVRAGRVEEGITDEQRQLPGEEAYVRQIVSEALAYSRSIGETDAPTKLGDAVLLNRRSDRLKRAERYARWRYRGWRNGEVASL